MQDRRLFRQLSDPTRSGSERLLGELESDVMEAVWAQGRASVRRVLDLLNASRPAHIAYTTVLTVMQRLAEKGLLERQRVGNTDHYAACQSREAFFSESSGRIVRALLLQLHLCLEVGKATLVVATAGLGLMVPSPARPGEHEG